jgi:hypothetical protein
VEKTVRTRRKQERRMTVSTRRKKGRKTVRKKEERAYLNIHVLGLEPNNERQDVVHVL